MRKHQKTLVFVLCLAALLALLLTAARNRQPTYQGHSLQYWLEICDAGAYADADVTPEQVRQAEEAVRRIGTNALPCLLKWMAYEPHDWQTRLSRAISRLPVSASSRILLNRATLNRTKYYRAQRTPLRFQILGEAAAPAIPDLVRLLHATNSIDLHLRAVRALSFICPSGFPPLLDALSNTNFPVPSEVVRAIGNMRDLGTNASPAIPLLIRCIQDSRPDTATSAIDALGNLRIELETVVPALTNAFAAKKREVRYRAVSAFAYELSDHANQAAPALRGMLDDPDPEIREQASNILARIATQAITNAPAR